MQKKAEERWGASVVEQVCLDLQREFPNADGFSTKYLWFMKKWYLFYSSAETSEKLHQLGREIGDGKLLQPVKELKYTGNEQTQKLYQTGREFPAPFALVPWRHHVEIISKCKSIDEALFYIGKTIEQGMSRAALVNCIKANLYEHQGKILNNFAEHMPA